jgi:hypothetical protein
MYTKIQRIIVQVIPGHYMRHAPPTGAGLVQGGRLYLIKQVFSRAKYFGFFLWTKTRAGSDDPAFQGKIEPVHNIHDGQRELLLDACPDCG